MIARPLNKPGDATYNNIVKWSSRLRIPLDFSVRELKYLLVIGDGTPDDIVSLILLNKYNRVDDKIIGIVKPSYLGAEAVRAVSTLVNKSDIDISMLFIDQEDKALEELWNLIYQKIREYLDCSDSKFNNDTIDYSSLRIKIFKCKTIRHSFFFIVVINGLSDFSCRKHTIEDHLVKLAMEKLNLDKNYNVDKRGCSKGLWNNLSSREKRKVFDLLRDLTIKETSKYFPQHIRALTFLEDNHL